MLNPDMPADQLRLMAGEMTAQEIRTARAFIRAANAKAEIPMTDEVVKSLALHLYNSARKSHGMKPLKSCYGIWVDGDHFKAMAEKAIAECNKIIRGK